MGTHIYIYIYIYIKSQQFHIKIPPCSTRFLGAIFGRLRSAPWLPQELLHAFKNASFNGAAASAAVAKKQPGTTEGGASVGCKIGAPTRDVNGAL